MLGATKESAPQIVVALSDTKPEPRITHPPTLKNLEIRDNTSSQSPNFIGYYYTDGSWQSTGCGTQTSGVTSLLGYCYPTGNSCDHPTGCSAGYVLGPQGPFSCLISGYTCGTAFIASSFGAQPVTTFFQCYPPDTTLTSWYRVEDPAVASTTSSSSTSSMTASSTTSSLSPPSITARQVLGPEAGVTGVSIQESRGYSHVGSPVNLWKPQARA